MHVDNEEEVMGYELQKLDRNAIINNRYCIRETAVYHRYNYADIYICFIYVKIK